MHLLQDLLLVHLVRVEERMSAALAAILRASSRVLETRLSRDDAPLAALHLHLSWQCHGSCTRSRSGRVRTLGLVQLNAAQLARYLVHHQAVMSVGIREATAAVGTAGSNYEVVLVG